MRNFYGPIRNSADRKAQKKQTKAVRGKHQERFAKTLSAVASDPRMRDLFRAERFVLIDGGAQGGLEKEWTRFAPLLRVMAVEPRSNHGLTDADFDVTLLNLALDRTEGTRDLYLAKSMTSFLYPNYDVCEQFNFAPPNPPTKVSVQTTTLDAIVAEHRLRFVDFVKLDTQGSELDILQGGPETIGRMAIGMRVEVCFSELYDSQPLFADVDVYARSQGFSLVDIVHAMRRLHTHVAPFDPDELVVSSGQLIAADGLYFRTPERLVEIVEGLAADDRVRYMAGALVACLTYNRLDLAARYLHDTESLLDSSSSTVMLQLLRFVATGLPSAPARATS